MGGALLSETLTEVLIPVAAVVGIAFALIQWFLVSRVKVAPDHSHTPSNNNKNGYTEYLIEEEEGVNDHNVVNKCAEIQNAISEGMDRICLFCGFILNGFWISESRSGKMWFGN